MTPGQQTKILWLLLMCFISSGDYAIDYFAGDYRSITSKPVQHSAAVSRSLYDGNMSRQTVAIYNFQRLNKQYMTSSTEYEALPYSWNSMMGIFQFQTRPNARYIFGRAAFQG